MMSVLLNIPAMTLMELWGELVECYHGVNGYGGNTAEIYAYRFQMYIPTYHSTAQLYTERDKREHLALKCNAMLKDLCALFAEKYDCCVKIGGWLHDEWPESYLFDHRINVAVEHK